MPVINIYPSDDSYIAQNIPDTNYGAAISLPVQRGLGQERAAFFKWSDLSTIPLGSTIHNAVFYWYKSQGGSIGGTYVTYLVTSSWDESTITWATRPSITAPNLNSWNAAPGWENCGGNLYTTFKNWFTGAVSNHGIRLLTTADTTGNQLHINSHENANNKPYFAVDYQPPGSFIYNMI